LEVFVARPGLRKINQYSEEFKATAVGLSGLPGVLIQDVTHSLDIHPFMLSRWRKEMREGMIVAKKVNLEPQRKAEFKRLREVERQYKRLQEEHAILKKAIRFASERRQKSSSSSKQTGRSTRSK
jgi:transposase